MGSFSFKYRISNAFVHLRPLCHIPDFASKARIGISASSLIRGLRLVRLYCGQIEGHGPRELQDSEQ